MPSTLKDVPGFQPHGGALELRMVGDDERADLLTKAEALPKIEAKARRVLSDLELLAVGAVSPEPRLHERGRTTSRWSTRCVCRAVSPGAFQ